MRLFRLGGDDFKLRDEAGKRAGKVELYVDGATGQVYALSPELRDDLDPLWREDDPAEV